MIRHWKLHVKPLLEAIAPKQVMEIGADTGANTVKLLTYCRGAGAKLDVIDPAPRPSLDSAMKRFKAECTYFKALSLEAIPLAAHPDVVLLDGDHNWSTVYRELTLFRTLSRERDRAFPIILAHDVAWPYARRDMYYAPDTVPDKHPYAYAGLLPGIPGTVAEGMNEHLANALEEGGPRNGVLTAFEDFIAEDADEFHFTALPFFNGLGILVPVDRMTPALQSVIEGFSSGEHLKNVGVALETAAMTMMARLMSSEQRVSRQTDALEQANARLQDKDAQIEALRAEIGSLKGSTS